LVSIEAEQSRSATPTASGIETGRETGLSLADLSDPIARKKMGGTGQATGGHQ
jgi:hypothetical protein